MPFLITGTYVCLDLMFQGQVHHHQPLRSSHPILYYFDQVFTILEKKWAEMADNFSFDLRRIKKNSFFFVVMCDVNTWSK